jgi:uncharacterized membrane protein
MVRIKKSIEVDCPLSQVYNQWTQFEEFPRFMDGVKEIRQLDDQRLHWRAEIAGVDKEWTAKITEQIPDDRIAWTSESGEYTSGMVDFAKLGEERTPGDIRDFLRSSGIYRKRRQRGWLRLQTHRK